MLQKPQAPATDNGSQTPAPTKDLVEEVFSLRAKVGELS